MLGLTMKSGESLFITLPAGTVIEEDAVIEVNFVKNNGKRTRIGVDAPKEFKALRDGPYRGGMPAVLPEPEPEPSPALT